MIKFGAQEIISTANSEMNEANIDAILEHSLKKTQEISNELAKIEDKFNLNNVSLTGDEPDAKASSLYTFEGLDYKKKETVETNALADFIDVGRRERIAQNYNVDSYYRQAMATTSGNQTGPVKEKRKLKGWRLTVGGGYDHQFFNSAELDRLAAKEEAWLEYCKQKQDLYDGKLPKAEFDKLTIPATFTDEDEDLKTKLLDEGWSTWNKKDFFNFIRMAEKYGRDGIGGRGYLECT